EAGFTGDPQRPAGSGPDVGRTSKLVLQIRASRPRQTGWDPTPVGCEARSVAGDHGTYTETATTGAGGRDAGSLQPVDTWPIRNRSVRSPPLSPIVPPGSPRQRVEELCGGNRTAPEGL